MCNENVYSYCFLSRMEEKENNGNLMFIVLRSPGRRETDSRPGLETDLLCLEAGATSIIAGVKMFKLIEYSQVKYEKNNSAFKKKLDYI